MRIAIEMSLTGRYTSQKALNRQLKIRIRNCCMALQEKVLKGNIIDLRHSVIDKATNFNYSKCISKRAHAPSVNTSDCMTWRIVALISQLSQMDEIIKTMKSNQSPGDDIISG